MAENARLVVPRTYRKVFPLKFLASSTPAAPLFVRRRSLGTRWVELRGFSLEEMMKIRRMFRSPRVASQGRDRISSRTSAVRRASYAALEKLENRELFAIVQQNDFLPVMRSGFTVSSTDLINGLVPAPSETNYARSFEGGPIDNLTDGKTSADPNNKNEFSNQQNAIFSLDAGTGQPPHGAFWYATYRLDLTNSPSGYDITQIDSITGHQDNRSDQTIDIEVQFVGDDNFVSLSNDNNFSFRPGGDNDPSTPGGDGAGRIRLTDSSGGPIARGVRAIRFQADQEAVYRELDVFGTASPVPTAGPAAPTNLQANTSGSNVVLTFTDNSANESRFLVERAAVVNGVVGSFNAVGTAPPNNTPAPGGVGGTVTFTDTTTEIGATYQYRVRAFNLFNGGTSSSAVTANVTTPTTGQGLAVRYFPVSRWKGNPILTQIDTNLSDNIFGGGSPAATVPTDQFSAIYSGKFTPTVTGSYSFDINVDDQGLLFIGGGDSGAQTQINDLSSIELTAGVSYSFVFLASEDFGAATFNLQYTPPDGTEYVQIPGNLFTSQQDPVAQDQAPSSVNVQASTPTSVTIGFLDQSINEVKFQLERAVVTNNVPGSYSVVAEDVPNSFQLVDPSANPGTTYSYRVRAFNFSGSAVSDAIVVTTDPRVQANGATGAWYSTGFWGLPGRPSRDGLAVAANPNYREEVTQIDFPDPTLNRPDQGIPTDNFSTVFTGKLVIPAGQGGVYTLISNTDDDGALFVNGVLVSYDPGGHGQRDPDDPTAGQQAFLQPITLQPGQYNFVLMQAEQGGGAGATFRWQGPATGDSRETVPQENLINISDLPVAPGQGTAETATATTVVINFADNSTSELRYKIEQSTNPNFTTIDRTYSAPINAARYVVTDLTPNTHYYFRIRGTNLEGEGPAITTDISTTTQNVPPAAPTNLTARPTNDRLITLNFTDNTEVEDAYIITRRVGASGNFVQVGSVGPNVTTFVDQVFPAQPRGTQVTYRVVARSNEGDSTAAEVTTFIGAPGGTGLNAIAYANPDFTDDPENPTDTVSYLDPEIGENFSLGPPVAGIPEDNFSVRWTGFVQAEKSEPYQFQIQGEDTMTLMVMDTAGNVIVDLTSTAGAAVTSDPVDLVAGTRYAIVATLVEADGGASAFLRWTSTTTPLEVIPQVFLFPTNSTTPVAQNVYVRGSAWTPAFRNFVATQSGQDSNLGFKVTGFGASSPVLSFTNLNQIAVKFSSAAPAVASSQVTVSSAGNRTYTVSSVTADPSDPSVLLVTLASPIVNDRVTINLAGVASAGGANTSVTLNVLPGDANQSGGAVQASDLVLTRNRVGRTTASPGTGNTAYSIFNDFDGNGVINATDLVLVRNRVGQAIPPAPALFSASRIAPARASAVDALKDDQVL